MELNSEFRVLRSKLDWKSLGTEVGLVWHESHTKRDWRVTHVHHTPKSSLCPHFANAITHATHIWCHFVCDFSWLIYCMHYVTCELAFVVIACCMSGFDLSYHWTSCISLMWAHLTGLFWFCFTPPLIQMLCVLACVFSNLLYNLYDQTVHFTFNLSYILFDKTLHFIVFVWPDTFINIYILLLF